MIVYVESNFVLELAYLQEEHESCEEILRLAEEGRITLVLPAYSIGEPYDAWVRKSNRRKDVHGSLSAELTQLSRSKPYVDRVNEFQEITRILVQSGEEEKERLNNVVSRILETADVVPIEREVIKTAINVQMTRNLPPQDSIVYASVLSHLSLTAPTVAKCFITKNSKDFRNPDIEAELESYACKLLTKFGDGLGYTKHSI